MCARVCVCGVRVCVHVRVCVCGCMIMVGVGLGVWCVGVWVWCVGELIFWVYSNLRVFRTPYTHEQTEQTGFTMTVGHGSVGHG